MPISYSQSSGFSIPSTGNTIPDGPDKFEEHYGLVTLQAFRKKSVSIFIGVTNFTMKLPPQFRSPQWFHYNLHTELTFTVSPEDFPLVIDYAQAMSNLIP